MYSFVYGGALRSIALDFCVRGLTDAVVSDRCSRGRVISNSSSIGGGGGIGGAFWNEALEGSRVKLD